MLPLPRSPRTACTLASLLAGAVVLAWIAPEGMAMLAPALLVMGLLIGWPVAVAERPIAWVRRIVRRRRRAVRAAALAVRPIAAALRPRRTRVLAFALANRPPPLPSR